MADSDQPLLNNEEDRDLHGLFNSSSYEDGIALALSGGGFKAAAYHLGSLIRLNEVGLLPRIKRVTSVSGGSITAGFLGMKWKELDFDASGVARNFTPVFVEPLRHFLLKADLDARKILLGLLNPFESGADGLAKGYDEWLFGGRTLQDLPDDNEGPRFIVLATNYELNTLWRFSKPYAADYRVGKIETPRFSLAHIVAASSGFPPFFCPLKLDLAGHTVTPQKGNDRHLGRFLQRALLCDGGIYDNMGLEPIWRRYSTLLVSNAGDGIEENEMPGDWFNLLRRIMGLVHRQAENNRQRVLMLLAKTGERKVAYWPLRNDGKNYLSPSPVSLAPDEISAAQLWEVRLRGIKGNGFSWLANHGYSLCDAALRSHLNTQQPDPKLPFSR